MSAGVKPAKLFTAGQAVVVEWNLIVVGRRHSASTETTVQAVGTRWATFKADGIEYRADACTGRVDGARYSSPGRLWPDPAAYHASTELNGAWQALSFKIRDLPKAPDGVTAEDIVSAARLLRITQ